jgi:hypothetical protein
MEIHLEMLFQYLVTRGYLQRHDVPMHVHADVCPPIIFHLFYVRLSENYRREPLHILLRCKSFVLQTWYLVNTSARMQLLSP